MQNAMLEDLWLCREPPERSVGPPVTVCAGCGEWIHAGDGAYDLDGALWCVTCVADSYRIAESEGPPDWFGEETNGGEVE